MFKKPEISPNFKMPTLKGSTPGGEKLGNFPLGSFIGRVERCRIVPTKKNMVYVCVESTVLEILDQTPTADPNDPTITDAVKVGERRNHWFNLQDEWGYGAADWASLLRAVGTPEDELDEVGQAAVGEEQPITGQEYGVRRVLQLNKAKKFFPKEVFSAKTEEKPAE